MINYKVAIVIPIYKNILTENEHISLLRAFEIFHSYLIIFVAPRNLDLEEYKVIVFDKKIKCQFLPFDEIHFKNLKAYNKLMLSESFYIRFVEFDYILIYQLDSYVFSDELKTWCNRGFDYIGAPWIALENHKFNIEEYSGNGGFSLRKVPAFLKTLEMKRQMLFSPKQLIKQYSYFGLAHLIKKIPLILLRILGYRNNSKYYIDSNEQKEDVFWSVIAPAINRNFKVAKGIDSICFAFERYPCFLYKLNNNKLPFGCHAWEKYEPSFWEQFIHKNRNNQ